MNALLQLLDQSPERILTVCALLLATSFALYFKRRLTKDFEGFEHKMAAWLEIMERHKSETRDTIQTHTENMGKATRAMNGDMLKIRESVFDLKQDFTTKATELKSFAIRLQAETRAMAREQAQASEQFELRFGALSDLNRGLANVIGSVKQIEADFKGFRIESIRTDERLTAAGRILKAHADTLERLKKEKV